MAGSRRSQKPQVRSRRGSQCPVRGRSSNWCNRPGSAVRPSHLADIQLAALRRQAVIRSPGCGITLPGIWDLSDFRLKDDPQYGSNRIAGMPVNVTRAALAYSRPAGSHISASAGWVLAGPWADGANTLRVPGYTAGRAATKGLPQRPVRVRGRAQFHEQALRQRHQPTSVRRPDCHLLSA